ncbi:MAG: cysteine hydrolase family protein [Bacillota bacterium]|jgi:nicotinamidase/pyrazinamidase
MKALIVIDMLEDFIEKEGALYVGQEGEELIPFINQKIQEFRQAGAPIIFIADSHEEDDSEFDMFQPHCITGTPGSDIVAALDVQPGDRVIRKRRYSAFFGTDLDITLRERGVDELYLVGVCTNICVLYTAADARNLGYTVNIYRDGVASFDQAAHDFALSEAEKTLGCRVI